MGVGCSALIVLYVQCLETVIYEEAAQKVQGALARIAPCRQGLA